VALEPLFAEDAPYLRKTRLQLASKMRYIAAQYEVYLGQGLWKRNAEVANATAARLVARLAALPHVHIAHPVETNAIFAGLPPVAAERLRQKYFFYDWEGGLVRWMTSFDTAEADIEGFSLELAAALAAAG